MRMASGRMLPNALSFLFPFWHNLRSYRPHLEVRDPILSYDWPRSLHQTVSGLRFSGVFLSPKVSARRSVHSVSFHYHPYHYPTDVTDVTLGTSGLWLGTRAGAGGTATLAWSLFWPQPMALWSAGIYCWQYFEENIVLNCMRANSSFQIKFWDGVWLLKPHAHVLIHHIILWTFLR